MARLATSNLFWLLAILCITATLFSGPGNSAPTTPPSEALQSCRSNLKEIGTALEMYSTDHGGLFPACRFGGLRVLVPNYLGAIPTCPTAEGDTYTRGFLSAVAPDAYTIICHGNYHLDVGYPSNYPQYTSTQGLVAP